MDFSFFDTASLFGVAPLGLLIVCSFVFVAGYIDAIAGGGGFISLPAYLIAGVPTHVALATNKLSSSMGTFVATLHYVRSGFVDLRLALPAVAFACLGSCVGSSVVLLVSDAILRVAFLVILPITAIYVLRSKSIEATAARGLSFRATVFWCCGIALVVGFYDGFYGPGTGTFLMLALNGLAQLRLDKAAGITKAVNLTTNVSALVVFFFHGQVYVVLGLVAGLFSIAGNYLGSHRFTKSGSAIARPVTLIVVALFFVKALSDVISL